MSYTWIIILLTIAVGSYLFKGPFISWRTSLAPTPAPPVMPAPRLSSSQARVLGAMQAEIGVPANDIAAETGLTRSTVIRAMRDLREAGLADYGFLMTDDQAKLVGRGYWLNDNGVAARDRLRGEAA